MTPPTKPGRPRSEFPIRYQLRCRPEDLEAWTQLAEREGRTLQNWIRWTLGKAAKRLHHREGG
jgi:hypothetical protein